MDWPKALERNREALMGIVAALFAMLELAGTPTIARISVSLHRAVLRVLRPAESAVRGLVVIAARGLTVKLPASRPMPAGPIGSGSGSGRRASFQLFDPRKRFALSHRGFGKALGPRIHVFANDPRVAVLWRTQPSAEPSAPPEPQVNAKRLCRRLHALKLALEDLTRQARRLARWQARRKKIPNPKFTSPLRLGPPPGHRRKPVHEVDVVLAECHWLACDAMKLNTS